jgi:hypothetical protein
LKKGKKKKKKRKKEKTCGGSGAAINPCGSFVYGILQM